MYYNRHTEQSYNASEDLGVIVELQLLTLIHQKTWSWVPNSSDWAVVHKPVTGPLNSSSLDRAAENLLPETK